MILNLLFRLDMQFRACQSAFYDHRLNFATHVSNELFNQIISVNKERLDLYFFLFELRHLTVSGVM